MAVVLVIVLAASHYAYKNSVHLYGLLAGPKIKNLK